MSVKVKSKFGLRGFCSHKVLVFVSLLFVMVLVFSCFVSVFSGVSPFASGASSVVVSNEAELRAAVNGAVGFTVIVLDANISITNPLVVLKDRAVMLTSAGGMVCGLIGTVDTWDVIGVDGVLTIDGIFVTHANGVRGRGVVVNNGGMFNLSSGVIFGNTVADYGGGGGVWSEGVFMMSGGEIVNNTAFDAGGGVFVGFGGYFEMFGGVISGNVVTGWGGGVYVQSECYFSLFGGGVIADNVATRDGGGVYVGGVFSMSGNVTIVGNVATGYGGGVRVSNGDFCMLGGEVSGNRACWGGGVSMSYGSFNMSDGVISNNIATQQGGGVYAGGDYHSGHASFNLLNNGRISHNTAYTDGGGIYLVQDCIFRMYDGEISNNVANNDGGGIGVPTILSLEHVYIYDDAVFSNNYASTSCNRNSTDDQLYNSHINNNTIWTTPFTQGYNNYDIQYIYNTQNNNNTNPPPSTSTPNASNNIDDTTEWLWPSGYTVLMSTLIIIVLVVIIVMAVLFFTSNKKLEPIDKNL